MKNTIIITLCVLATLGLASAECGLLDKYEEDIVGLYTPFPFNNEVIDIVNYDDQYIGTITIEDNSITQTTCTQDTATMTAFVQTEETYNNVYNAEADFLVTFQQEYLDDNVVLKGNTFTKSVTTTTVKAVSATLNFFTKLF